MCMRRRALGSLSFRGGVSAWVRSAAACFFTVAAVMLSCLRLDLVGHMRRRHREGAVPGQHSEGNIVVERYPAAAMPTAIGGSLVIGLGLLEGLVLFFRLRRGQRHVLGVAVAARFEPTAEPVHSALDHDVALPVGLL